MKFNFADLYLMDKNENELTELNRTLIRDYKKNK